MVVVVIRGDTRRHERRSEGGEQLVGTDADMATTPKETSHTGNVPVIVYKDNRSEPTTLSTSTVSGNSKYASSQLSGCTCDVSSHMRRYRHSDTDLMRSKLYGSTTMFGHFSRADAIHMPARIPNFRAM